ncbi:hypothetical protein E1091_00110 [Micromonospora fluostatini]|uniref:Uncharacterized protein n=1 Tax=Micromonospora fluostatini TaxID=1629071 RepID=A0ABY2DM69_9ACTN|nr:hypothetical protein E1091_00110 [Micromonospora fluostatini]
MSPAPRRPDLARGWHPDHGWGWYPAPPVSPPQPRSVGGVALNGVVTLGLVLLLGLLPLGALGLIVCAYIVGGPLAGTGAAFGLLVVVGAGLLRWAASR